jgi:hypothetical protein
MTTLDMFRTKAERMLSKSSDGSHQAFAALAGYEMNNQGFVRPLIVSPTTTTLRDVVRNQSGARKDSPPVKTSANMLRKAKTGTRSDNSSAMYEKMDLDTSYPVSSANSPVASQKPQLCLSSEVTPHADTIDLQSSIDTGNCLIGTAKDISSAVDDEVNDLTSHLRSCNIDDASPVPYEQACLNKITSISANMEKSETESATVSIPTTIEPDKYSLRENTT